MIIPTADITAGTVSEGDIMPAVRQALGEHEPKALWESYFTANSRILGENKHIMI